MGGTVSLYDALKARKTGLSPDLYTLLRAQREMPERVIAAEPPIYFKSDGTAISEYQISGDTVQSGTPTLGNPVEVLGVGNRTANLFDKSTITVGNFATVSGTTANDSYYCSDFIPITSATYYFQNAVGSSYQNTVVVYDANKQGLRYVKLSGSDKASGATIFQSGDAYIRINYYYQTDVDTVMTNIGSTALPYEPYGYKIPIALNSVTQNVYLDEPLYSGDYIKRNADGTGVLHQDGADTPITLPQLLTVKGNNELNISTTVTPEATLKGKIKQLPDNDMNALLSVMEET